MQKLACAVDASGTSLRHLEASAMQLKRRPIRKTRKFSLVMARLSIAILQVGRVTRLICRVKLEGSLGSNEVCMARALYPRISLCLVKLDSSDCSRVLFYLAIYKGQECFGNVGEWRS